MSDLPVCAMAVSLRLRSSTDVGDLAGNRIYPLQAPSSAVGAIKKGKPYIRYQQIGGVYSVSHSSGGPSYQRARVQVDAFSNSWEQANRLATRARRRLEGYRGSTGGVLVWNIEPDAPPQDFSEGEGGDDRFYRVFQDFQVEARVST